MKHVSQLLLSALIISTAGCGGDGSITGSYSGDDVVTGLRASPSALAVGDSATIKVSFTPELYTPPDTDQTDDDAPSSETAAFDLVVLLPPGLDFIEGTSQLTDSFLGDVVFGNEDPRGPNRRGPCLDGSFYLLYQFSFDELSADTPLDQVMEFRAIASAPSGPGVLRAEAAPNLSGNPCAIRPEQTFGVTLG